MLPAPEFREMAWKSRENFSVYDPYIFITAPVPAQFGL